jgi:hypothetical protein
MQECIGGRVTVSYGNVLTVRGIPINLLKYQFAAGILMHTI